MKATFWEVEQDVVDRVFVPWQPTSYAFMTPRTEIVRLDTLATT